MRDHSFEEVMDLDRALYQLSFYDITRGRIIAPDSEEELFEVQRNVAERFNYFKMMIQRGSCTLDFIKWQVLEKNGPFLQEKIDPDNENFIESITSYLDYEKSELKNRKEKKIEDDKTKNIVDLLMDRFSSEIKKIDAADPKDKCDDFDNYDLDNYDLDNYDFDNYDICDGPDEE